MTDVAQGRVEALLKGSESLEEALALEALGSALQEQLGHIRAALGRLGDAPAIPALQAAESVDRGLLDRDLRQLATQLADLDSAAGASVERLAPRLAAVGQAPAAQQLQKLVAEFEFDEAQSCLQRLNEALGFTA